MKPPARKVRCAIYTRVSTDERLDMEFNSLDAQREAGAAYVESQKHEGWLPVGDRYDDGGFSGGTLERPALQRLIADIEGGRIDVVVPARTAGSGCWRMGRIPRSTLWLRQKRSTAPTPAGCSI